MMAKYQRPIRGIRNEIFDVDQTCKQRDILLLAYSEFWAGLDDETKKSLDLMLA
jgi:hypothetical protein